MFILNHPYGMVVKWKSRVAVILPMLCKGRPTRCLRWSPLRVTTACVVERFCQCLAKIKRICRTLAKVRLWVEAPQGKASVTLPNLGKTPFGRG
jgi:hypothetical protein